jgi:hypothetical protein
VYGQRSAKELLFALLAKSQSVVVWNAEMTTRLAIASHHLL